MPRIKAELSPTTSPQLQRQTVPRINAAPAVPADSPHTPQSTNMQPTTPSKRRRQRAESDDDYEPETPSPTKRIKTPRGAPLTPARTPVRPPQTPSSVPPTPSTALRTLSQKSLRAAQRKQEKEWESDWYAVVALDIWTFNRHFKHPDHIWTICLKKAMEQFPIKRGELDMLPYESRLNPHNPRCPMRLYNIETVRQTACLKHAMLFGLHKTTRDRTGLSKAELVSRGEELWKAALHKRDQKYIDRRFRRVMPTPSRARDGPNDTEPRTWDAYNCGYDQRENFTRRINE
ncbi:hypothetical protein NA56DRAFT_695471 [Hyaloscypha hepaticicola]|uniref:Uncharacterized protein n=1 Tax=Hyaloscypha hepaticicola TaxID=2082293 RepID=A0A2J6PEN8_9HELO|nr:hypothetical protein NA56DRAFT_695471 [Hyaloscypha hepaticicola]